MATCISMCPPVCRCRCRRRSKKPFEQLPRSWLFHGFTTVVTLGVIDPETLERFAASPLHPDVYHCGPAIPVENGYPMDMAPPDLARVVFPNYPADPQQADSPPDTVDRSPRAAVQRVVQAGGICAKTVHEDGFGEMSDSPVPSAAMLAALREETHAHDIPLVIHASSYNAWKAAGEVPADIIAHGRWNWDGQTPTDGDSLPATIRVVLDSVLTRGIAFMPTLRVEGLAALYDPEFLEDPRLARVLPAAVIDGYRTPEAGGYARELAGGRSPERMRATWKPPSLRRRRDAISRATQRPHRSRQRHAFESDIRQPAGTQRLPRTHAPCQGRRAARSTACGRNH